MIAIINFVSIESNCIPDRYLIGEKDILVGENISLY